MPYRRRWKASLSDTQPIKPSHQPFLFSLKPLTPASSTGQLSIAVNYQLQSEAREAFFNADP